MAKTLQICNTIFPTKKAAKDFIREIISRHENNETLKGNDFSFIYDLLSVHPESEQKIGCGVSRIFVDLDAQYKKNKCFYLTRTDGSSTDFSWISCIDGRNIRREIFDAFRNAITYQIEEFKKEKLTDSSVCPYTNEKLNNGNSHVDHESPLTFYSLVNKFLKEESIDLFDVKISEPQDNQFTTSLINNQLIERWKKYHLKNAKLRIISATGNLSHAKKS